MHCISDTESTDASSLESPAFIVTNNNHKSGHLLEIYHLPNDCGIKTLQSILLTIDNNIKSIHFRKEEKAAILRIPTEKSLTCLQQFIQRFEWKSKVIKYSQYLSFNDDACIWQYKESNYWNIYDIVIAELIEKIPIQSSVIFDYNSKRLLIEKYSKNQGRQINQRTNNQRIVRRITLNVWISEQSPNNHQTK